MKELRPNIHAIGGVTLCIVPAFLGIFAFASPVSAQTFSSLQAQKTPLILKARGSFFVGGELKAETANQVGLFAGQDGGHVTVKQMYVQYMVPETAKRRPPLAFLHGCCLSAKTWETTADGRMGWDEYFVRAGYPVYLADQVTRGRSGFDQSTFNDVRAGIRPPSDLPRIDNLDEETSIWRAFRVGPTYGTPFPDSQFPVAAIHEFSKQAIPDMYDGTQLPNPNFDRLSELAAALHGAVLVGHSMGAGFVLETAAAHPDSVIGIVAIEGGCPFNRPPFTDDEIRNLTRMPILLVYGDHLNADTGIGFSWEPGFEECKAFVARVNAAEGHARMLHLPELGIHGNTHLLMSDKNNIEIARLIDTWLRENITNISTRSVTRVKDTQR